MSKAARAVLALLPTDRWRGQTPIGAYPEDLAEDLIGCQDDQAMDRILKAILEIERNLGEIRVFKDEAGDYLFAIPGCRAGRAKRLLAGGYPTQLSKSPKPKVFR